MAVLILFYIIQLFDMNELMQPDNTDLLRETIIIIIGLIVRWFEKKKLKDNVKH